MTNFIKTEKAIEYKERWSGLHKYIELVDSNLEKEPNVALDSAKSLLETIAKTILSDKGVEYKTDASIGRLIKKAFESMPVFAKISSEDLQSAKSILGSFENISKQIGEFRNRHGAFSHGQDIQSDQFNKYLTNLAISSADLLASFLIISHAEDLKDRSRVYYEEHDEFNRYIDETSEEIPIVMGYQLSPSQSLFTDPEAYKEALYSFINDKENLITQLEESESFVQTRRICAGLIDYEKFLTTQEVIRIVNSAIVNQNIYLILGHGYTRNFFQFVKMEYEQQISEDLYEKFVESFSKARW